MISLNPPTPEVPATMESLSNLLGLLSDPNASKARVAELSSASASLQRAIAESKAQMATFAITQADHEALIAQQSTDAAEKLAADQKAFDEACLQRKQLLDDREARLTELQSEAAADAKAAKIARSDFERRLAIIKTATG